MSEGPRWVARVAHCHVPRARQQAREAVYSFMERPGTQVRVEPLVLWVFSLYSDKFSLKDERNVLSIGCVWVCLV